MARCARHARLNVFLNNRHVGSLNKHSNGAIEFTYDRTQLDWENAIQISLSLPLRETRFTGERVVAVFENLLPDSVAIRTRVAERVGAAGTDAYSLLTEIGRDCVGALQFLPGSTEPEPLGEVNGVSLDDEEIAAILSNLALAPLGLNRDDNFRISIAARKKRPRSCDRETGG